MMTNRLIRIFGIVVAAFCAAVVYPAAAAPLVLTGRTPGSEDTDSGPAGAQLDTNFRYRSKDASTAARPPPMMLRPHV